MNDNMQPLVTVAILSYRNLDCIKDCLLSIFEQSYPRIQLIISDDGSDDFDVEWLNSLVETYRGSNIEEFMIHQMEKNEGTSRNFNYALKLAKGKYVKFIAADDLFYDEDSLAKMVSCAELESSNVVIARAPCYDRYLMWHICTYPSDADWSRLVCSAKQPKEFFGIMSEYCLISAPATLFNRQFLMDMGRADERYRLIEDWPLWMKMIREGMEFTFLNAPVVIYRSGGVSNGQANAAYAIHQIEYADVIKNECLAYPEFFSNRKAYRLARDSERRHRRDGERLLCKKLLPVKRIAVELHYSDISLKELIVLFSRWLEPKKGVLLLCGIFLMFINSVTQESVLFGAVLSEKSALFLGRIFDVVGAVLAWGSFLLGVLLYISQIPKKILGTIRYTNIVRR